MKRAAPALVAGAFALAYLIASPPSLDLAAHLLRAKLFATEGFGLWSNWWYGGHHSLSYSVLFPPIAAATSPQLAAAVAATATAAVFERLARERFGEDAWLGSLVFGAATATNLFTGRLTFAFGLLPTVGTALALQRRRYGGAVALAVLTALASPVAALFAALAGAADGIGSATKEGGRAALGGLAVAAAALLPVAFLSIAFPEGGTEPFALSAFWPLPLIAIGVLLVLPPRMATLRAALALYALGTVAAYLVSTPVGGNVARLGTFAAAPLAALLLWPRRIALLSIVALPLLYLEWQAPVRDLTTAVGDPSAARGYYRPLLAFLGRQPGPPFRVEVPFTQFHREAYVVAPRFPLARGWERQLDTKYNHLFYGGRLTPATYYAWLRELAVRYVAVSDAPLDYAGRNEQALIDRGLPYLEPVFRSRHWRVYRVRGATQLLQGAGTVTAIGANSVSVRATRPGDAYLRVRYTPYWALTAGAGCVAAEGDFTRLTFRRPGPAQLVIRFAPGRIGSRSRRCG